MTEDGDAYDWFRLVGCTLDEKFEVERVVDEGGFAVVYRGHHVMLGRPVALKVLKIPHWLDEAGRSVFVEGFVREARAMVRLNHPGIVQVLDFGVTVMPVGDEAPWMALEWCEGGTLASALEARRGRGGRSPDEALALLRPALDALACAHDAGVAHRDLKPANVMVVATRRGASLKLLDFGIAKVMAEGEDAGTGETRTRAQMPAFSLHYAAPEQIGGTRTGPWTDVHALALILTEVLTDSPPYTALAGTELFRQVLAPERPTPAARQVHVGRWEPVLRRALALRPADRFRDAGELLAALEAALEPVVVPSVAVAPPAASPAPDDPATDTVPDASLALLQLGPAAPGPAAPPAAPGPVAPWPAAPAAVTRPARAPRWWLLAACGALLLAAAVAAAVAAGAR